MKKFLPIIIGVLIGLMASVASIAYGEEEDVSYWNRFTTWGDTIAWKDIFGGINYGQDIYSLVYKKTLEDADNEALRVVAGNAGLTPEEAKAVLDGSITPIYNNRDRKSTELTQEEALAMLEQMRRDFSDLKELYEIRNEVELAVSPSEIFANGDTGDSGFDLVHDLSLIEEILFNKKSDLTVGGKFLDQQKTPFSPVEIESQVDDNIVSETPAAIDRLKFPQKEESEKPEILAEDFCAVENPLGDAIKDFDKANAAGNGRGNVNDLIGDIEIPDEDEDEEKKLQPAPADEWLKEWCPGFTDGSSSASNFSREGFGDFINSFTSIGGSSPAPMFAGASSGISEEGFTANASICLSVKLIRETYHSYNPGDTCIECEVKQINQLLEKTLSHSLIPNKATGNLLESAKCKNSAALLNFQVITIWKPIPTPANDDLIFGKNIFEEWNKFADRYQPVLLNKIEFDVDDAPNPTASGALPFYEKNTPSGFSQQQLLNEVRSTAAVNAANAVQKTKEFQLKDDVGNQILTFDKNILEEMKVMNKLFQAYKDIFKDISDEARKIKEKPNI